MKRFLLLSVLFVIALAACAPTPVEGVVATSSAVVLPGALTLAIGSLILAGVTIGLQVVFDSVGLDLRGIGAAIAVTLSGFAVAQLQGLVDVIPAQYDQLVTIVLNVLVVILGGLGTLRALFHPQRAAGLLTKK